MTQTGKYQLPTAQVFAPQVVVVDDDADDRLLMKLTFDQAAPDVQVLYLANGHEAIRYLSVCQTWPQLLITDLNMPCMSGLDVLNQIRVNCVEKQTSLPVVVMSTSMAPQDQDQCLQAGAKAFLSKPSDMDILLDMVRQIIADYEL